MINKEKIKAKVKKAIKKLPSQAVVKRAYTNDFGEKSDLLELVCELEGLYHESNNQYSQNITLQNKAEVIKRKNIYFLIYFFVLLCINLNKNIYTLLKNGQYITDHFL